MWVHPVFVGVYVAVQCFYLVFYVMLFFVGICLLVPHSVFVPEFPLLWWNFCFLPFPYIKACFLEVEHEGISSCLITLQLQDWLTFHQITNIQLQHSEVFDRFLQFFQTIHQSLSIFSSSIAYLDWLFSHFPKQNLKHLWNHS